MSHRKLSDEQVASVRSLRHQGWTISNLSVEFDVSTVSIRKILGGKMYTQPSRDAKRTGHIAAPLFRAVERPGCDPNVGRSYSLAPRRVAS